MTKYAQAEQVSPIDIWSIGRYPYPDIGSIVIGISMPGGHHGHYVSDKAQSNVILLDRNLFDAV